MKPIEPKIEALLRLPVVVMCAAAMLGIFVSSYITGMIGDALRRK